MRASIFPYTSRIPRSLVILLPLPPPPPVPLSLRIPRLSFGSRGKKNVYRARISIRDTGSLQSALSSESPPPRVFKQQPDGVGWWKYYLSTLVHLYREPLDIVGKSWRVSEKQLTTMLASPPLRRWWTPRWTKYVVPQRVQDARLERCWCRVDEGTTIDQSRSCHN